ncbi:MAG: HDOD domain-containing protein [Desulfovibrionaceae bacterium]|nr:HDOD domain-containing protein [Desulfovibrionaceae bacterium]MBF0514160.1 HDOD domain-containing protein [Desulfovibrionaceae bacterium]
MTRINTKELAAGMRLAEDVVGSNGRLLMLKDTELDAKHLRILNVWGVSEVEIAGSDSEQDAPARHAPADPEILAASERFALDIFGKAAASGEFAAELLRLTASWFAAKLQNGEPLPPRISPPPALPPAKPPPNLEKMLAKGGKIIACPDVYLRINEALKKPNCSVAHLADIVGKDIGLSAKLLQLVNSPIYGYSMKVDSLLRGITILGFKELSQLVLGLSVFNRFLGIRADVLNVREFLKHGLSCGILARILASHRPDLPEERFFIAGLLHDVGRMAMLTVAPAHLAAAMAKASREGLPLCAVEMEFFGFTHAEAGGALLAQWKLPPELEDPIRHHHEPAAAQDPAGASLLCVADCLATAMRFGFSGSAHLALADNAAWERLGQPLGVLESVMNQAQRQVEGALQSLMG